MSLKWDSYLTLSLITIFGTIPFTYISYTDYIWSAEPSQTEGINAIVYIMIWLVISFYLGYIQLIRFRKFSLIYFIIFILCSLLVHLPVYGIFLLPIVLGLGGTYIGLDYYFDLGTSLYIWGPLVTLMLTMFGYYTGSYLKVKERKRSWSNENI